MSRRKRRGLGSPSERLTMKQVRKLRDGFARRGESDLRPGECRRVHRGARKICRNTFGHYSVRYI